MFNISFLFIISLAAGQNLIRNGDFSNSKAKDLCKSKEFCVLTGKNAQKAIAPWVTEEEEPMVELTTKSSSGKYAFELSARKGFYIKQQIKTQVRKSYEVSFDLNENQCGVDKKVGEIRAYSPSGRILPLKTNLKTQFYYQKSEHGTEWRHMKYTFIATRKVTRIMFRGISEGDCGALVDNFSVVEVSG